MNIWMISCIVVLLLLVILFALSCCKAASDDYVDYDDAFEITELRDIDGK